MRLHLLRDDARAGAARLPDHLLGGGAAAGARCRMADVSVVVVTFNGLPWVEQCLESVRGHETIVVDNGSTDGTVGSCSSTSRAST